MIFIKIIFLVFGFEEFYEQKKIIKTWKKVLGLYMCKTNRKIWDTHLQSLSLSIENFFDIKKGLFKYILNFKGQYIFKLLLS